MIWADMTCTQCSASASAAFDISFLSHHHKQGVRRSFSSATQKCEKVALFEGLMSCSGHRMQVILFRRTTVIEACAFVHCWSLQALTRWSSYT